MPLPTLLHRAEPGRRRGMARKGGVRKARGQCLCLHATPPPLPIAGPSESLFLANRPTRLLRAGRQRSDASSSVAGTSAAPPHRAASSVGGRPGPERRAHPPPARGLSQSHLLLLGLTSGSPRTELWPVRNCVGSLPRTPGSGVSGRRPPCLPPHAAALSPLRSAPRLARLGPRTSPPIPRCRVRLQRPPHPPTFGIVSGSLH